MEYFKNYFKEVDFDAPSSNGEVKVVCPFHDDSDPSMHINVDKSIYNCFVCGVGGTEVDFISNVEEISEADAYALYAEMQSAPYSDWEYMQHANLMVDSEFMQKIYDIGLTDKTISELKLGLEVVSNHKLLAFPVFLKGTLVDVRRYNLDGNHLPKMLANPSEKPNNGHVIPYDVWAEDARNTTYIFEGEKDMAIAREHGLNAITLTGGAKALPNKFVINAFKDKDVIICYDNDDAGRVGAQKLGEYLTKRTKSVHTIDIGELVTSSKGDFHDYMHRDKGSLFAFMALEQKEIEISKVKKNKHTLNYVFENNLIGQKLVSDITVTGEFADAYKVDTFIEAKKIDSGDGTAKANTMALDEVRYWQLNEDNMEDILALIEVDAKDVNVRNRHLKMLGVPKDEQGVSVTHKIPKSVHKSYVVDSSLYIDDDSRSKNNPIELYTLIELAVGGQYEIEYQLYSHPTRNQKIVAIATGVTVIGDNKDFKVDKGLMNLLPQGGSLDDKVQALFQSARHYVAKHMDFDIWFATDLVFNSILDFYFDKPDETMRGALDLFILGDTQTGKSETTSALVDLYQFGHFLSLKNATTVGLIGGSNKVEGSYLNTIGALPRQHKKLVVMEEFSGAKPDFIKAMTDIRSSNVVRIARASGELVAPCKLRMITISNPIGSDEGIPRALASFPNAVQPITNLIKNAEDVIRYDGFVLAPKSDYRVDPFANQLTGEKIPKEVYEHKSQWVETRTADNVKFLDGVGSHIWMRSNELNEMFESNITIFGVTTYLKLARFSVALASLVFNVDETMENILVTKEIVDYMVDWLKEQYSQELFRLDEVQREWKRYNEYTEDDFKELQEIYNSNTTLIDFLSNESATTRPNLQAVSGQTTDNFSPIFEALIGMRAVSMNGNYISPTQKFRKMYRKLKRDPVVMTKKHTKTTGNVVVDLEI